MGKQLKNQLEDAGTRKALISTCKKYHAFCIGFEGLCYKILKKQVKGAYKSYAATCTQIAETCCHFTSYKALRRTGANYSKVFELYSARFLELASIFLEQSRQKTKRKG